MKRNSSPNNILSAKTILFTHILPALKDQSAYFSIDAVKRTLTADGIELADNSLRKYMSEAMATGIVVDAGRGWYSRHNKPVSLDPKPVANVIRDVKKVFPLLDFCCWSTVQFNPFALHLIAQPTTFLYAESDTLNSVADALRGIGWNAWANPVKNVVDQLLQSGEKTIALRLLVYSGIICSIFWVYQPVCPIRVHSRVCHLSGRWGFPAQDGQRQSVCLPFRRES